MCESVTDQAAIISGILRANLERSLEIHNRLIAECLPSLTSAAHVLIEAYRTGHKALFSVMAGALQTRSIWLPNSSAVTCATEIQCQR